MDLINQIGHIQHWGISPAQNVLFRYPLQSKQTNKQQKQKPLRILLSGCSDIRHLLKTVSDICQLKPERAIHFYLQQQNKPQLLSRMLLQLHILHQEHLNFDQRTQLFLDLYGNAMIKERNARYLNSLKEDLLNLIHDQKKKIKTPLKHLIKFDRLKFQEIDQMSQVISSWSNKVPFDMVKLRDTRLRCLFGQRYDYRSNLVDWDYNMLLNSANQKQSLIIHYYHYKQWRLNGLAFQQRFSTYAQPNRTLSSYVSGRKKQQKTSCLVRGYWGDIVLSPYLSMGIHTDYHQKDLLFKKANQKYIGHSVELTEYHLRYWLTMLEKMEVYTKEFRDYYRTDEKGREELDKADKDKKKKSKKTKQTEQTIQEKVQQEDQEDRPEQQKDIEQEMKEKEDQKKQQTKQQEEESIILNADSFKPKKPKLKPVRKDEQLDSDQQRQKNYIQAKDSKDIELKLQQKPVLPGFKAVQLQVYPMSSNIQTLTKPKFHQFFDVVVLGFIHSAYIKKGISQIVKKGGQIHLEKPTFLVPKKKEERKELAENMEKLIKQEGFQIEYQNKFFFVGEKVGEPSNVKKEEKMEQK